MTNNTQVVSVPRELLEHLHQHEDCPVEFIDALRRVLAAPAEDVRTAVDEPVAEVDESDDGLFIDFIYGKDGNPLQRGDKLYRRPSPLCSEVAPQCSEQVRIQAGILPAVLPHPPRPTGFLQPDREVPGYTIEQMKEYGAACVAAFAKQNGDQS